MIGCQTATPSAATVGDRTVHGDIVGAVPAESGPGRHRRDRTALTSAAIAMVIQQRGADHGRTVSRAAGERGTAP
ncbi:hypothetical protein GCM10010411_74830 [Actinomadura fulvescens]|uniref:Transposase n=1 Tax=Actinomadura fulvescens TaxID=46160 RepID=A0ABP6CUH0_9ACTN